MATETGGLAIPRIKARKRQRWTVFEINVVDIETTLDQHEEWFVLRTDRGEERLRIHDYERIYEIQGLYEEVVYRRLQCQSHRVVCSLLLDALRQAGEEKRSLSVLELGAGNGVAGECLRSQLPSCSLVGVDIIPQAREAAVRDRPGLYCDYHVSDFAELPAEVEAQLRSRQFNGLLTVGSLGFDDIPVESFTRALELLEPESWLAFNIKASFLEDADKSGFRKALRSMIGQDLEFLQTRQYRHRFSLSGRPLYYRAVAGRIRS